MLEENKAWEYRSTCVILKNIENCKLPYSIFMSRKINRMQFIEIIVNYSYK